MESELALTHAIEIKPYEMNKNLDKNIENALINMVSGKCVKEGIIKPNSIKIISRSIGTYDKAQFDGNIKYNIIYTAIVIIPTPGHQIETTIKDINKLGIMAQEDFMDIYGIFQLSDEKDIKNKMDVGDKIKLEIVGSKYNIGNDKMDIICKIIN